MQLASGIGAPIQTSRSLSMEKKSLINTLKSTKKVNVVTVPAKNEGGTSRKVTMKKAVMKKAVY